MSELATTPLIRVTAMNKPNAAAVMPRLSVQYSGRYGDVTENPVPMSSMHATSTR
ncbi:hypothetical protein GCM10010885_10040 [Alicyclobacillus cellulosilyticus]|uniref:Uncharacterized protein n=1 Tax=Alicyclobacillus cellulosilyticus TaxID=1003997 RepID=A0A917K7C9_9BACL|nr:hypothetical protein GCM10010885_10040 [Alicyclobacillus cellulosilyticus]